MLENNIGCSFAEICSTKLDISNVLILQSNFDKLLYNPSRWHRIMKFYVLAHKAINTLLEENYQQWI